MYKSIGTIAIEPDGDDAGAVKVIFDPVHDYSIKHGGNKYAVFVQNQKPIIKFMDGVANAIKLEGINEITELSDMKKVLDQIVLHAQVRAAATTRSKVQVWVEYAGNNLKLTNIMPA